MKREGFFVPSKDSIFEDFGVKAKSGNSEITGNELGKPLSEFRAGVFL